MGRYTANRLSGSGLAANSFIFNMGLWAVAGGFHLKLRRLWVGTEGAVIPSQVTLGLFRSTNRGSGAVNQNVFSQESSSLPSAAPAKASIDFSGWTVTPTIGSTPLVQRSFDVFSESEWVFEGQDELDSGPGGTAAASSGLALQVLDNAVPAGVSLAWSVIWEE